MHGHGLLKIYTIVLIAYHYIVVFMCTYLSRVIDIHFNSIVPMICHFIYDFDFSSFKQYS
jgi:hypothetical protein